MREVVRPRAANVVPLQEAKSFRPRDPVDPNPPPTSFRRQGGEFWYVGWIGSLGELLHALVADDVHFDDARVGELSFDLLRDVPGELELL